jgi:hypothetical protein
MSNCPPRSAFGATLTGGSRYEKRLPEHRVQVAVQFSGLKGVRRKDDRLTAIDGCIRIRVLRIYEQCGQRHSTGPTGRPAADSM